MTYPPFDGLEMTRDPHARLPPTLVVELDPRDSKRVGVGSGIACSLPGRETELVAGALRSFDHDIVDASDGIGDRNRRRTNLFFDPVPRMLELLLEYGTAFYRRKHAVRLR